MYNFKRLSLLVFIFLQLSCSQTLPTLQGIDLKLWKEDRNGCKGDRAKMIEAISLEKEKLKKLSEMDLFNLLGRPDENQLLDRNQKFFKYYLEPGIHCDSALDKPKMLILRINAMGLTKETMIM